MIIIKKLINACLINKSLLFNFLNLQCYNTDLYKYNVI